MRYYEDHKSMGGLFQPDRKREKGCHNDGEAGGGSAWVCRWETVDFTLPENREGVVRALISEDLAFFSTPVYAGRIPNKMLPYVQSCV